MNPKRTISETEKQMFLDLKPSDITKSLLTSLFADTYDANKNTIIKSQFNTYDEFKLKKGEYTNREDITTNCGLFIVNKYLYEEDWTDAVGGYMNTPMTKKQIGKIGDKIIAIVQKDETGEYIEKYIKFLNKFTWLQLTFNTEICTSMTLRSSKPLPAVEKRKKELFAKNADKLTSGDVNTAIAIQSELINLARKELADDPAMELYESGARGAFDNAYRQAQVMKGPVYNAANKKFEIMTNSLYEGATKRDLATYANAVVDGQYPKAIGTAESGYDTKKMAAAFQSESLDVKGSDCKSKSYMEVELTPDNATLFRNHYIIDGLNLVRLDETTQSKYMNKTVKLRMPSYCIGNKLCNMCAGDTFYILGIDAIGLTANRMSESVKQAKMKMAHDTTVRPFVLDPNNMFSKM